uniref:Uncharacterized protein n=1 Tax=Candidatus Kentrum sp. LFY TaxID=2126342 RepID=A0A450WMV9_9GAMM|nr:MAG: hypothetical protein BECKLFY1418C_GA0070996_10434 [Candidatus Kentron sp. LFY]
MNERREQGGTASETARLAGSRRRARLDDHVSRRCPLHLVASRSLAERGPRRWDRPASSWRNSSVKSASHRWRAAESPRAMDSLQAWQRQAASGGTGRPMTGSAYPMNDPQNNTDACNGSWKDVFEHAFPGERPLPAWTCVVPRPVRGRRISSIPWPWLKRIHAVVLAGGDTYGLDTTLGVVSIIPCAGLLGLGLY